MRRLNFARVSSVVGAVAGFALASWAVGAQDVRGAGATAAPTAVATPDAPELRPGEIVIRRTGHTKRVVTVSRQNTELTSQPPAAAATPARLPAAEDYDKPGPRSVTIGYLVRDPIEMGMGPQLNEPASPFLPNNSYGCNYFGYNSYLPTYGGGSYGGFGYGGGCRTYGGIGSYGGPGSFGSYRSYGSGSFGSFGGRSSFNPAAGPVTHATRAR
jgi:hypothetical protein